MGPISPTLLGVNCSGSSFRLDEIHEGILTKADAVGKRFPVYIAIEPREPDLPWNSFRVWTRRPTLTVVFAEFSYLLLRLRDQLTLLLPM